jgi:hypothetical protein
MKTPVQTAASVHHLRGARARAVIATRGRAMSVVAMIRPFRVV